MLLLFIITHYELANFLEPQGGHGQVWCDAHLKILTEVKVRVVIIIIVLIITLSLLLARYIIEPVS